jgi:hypothetical protein
MVALKPYFMERVGRKLTHTAQGGRAGGHARREYEIIVRGIEPNGILLASVSWMDSDRDGRKLPASRSEVHVARLPLRGLTGPAEALEDIARAVDPGFFTGQPAPKRNSVGADLDALEVRLVELADAERRPKGEAAPTAGSVQRLRMFWASTPNMALPDVFSSADGTLRARWNHGHDRTLWVNFPEKGPLGWSASIPRDGNSGMCKMNARCLEDQDILQCAALLGIRCTR